jgi:membrane protease YdiL (CAAX protease family)
MLVSALVLAPLFEEVIYRGLVQSAMLTHFGPAARWPIILAAALLFAAIHAGAVAWHVLPGLMVLGVLLGWLYERTGSLLAPVLVHMGFNLLNVVLALVMAKAAAIHEAGAEAVATLGTIVERMP